MTEAEALAEAAEKYRDEGYAVARNLPPDELPEALRRHAPSFVANRNGESVLVEVWVRGRINDLPPALLPAGWSFDVILLPPPGHPDAPGPGAEATPEFTGRLLDELDDLLPKKATRARFLVAWSAAESAMRVAAGRTGVAADLMSSRHLAAELATAGVISDDQRQQFDRLLAVRDRLAHGVPGDGPHAEQVEFLAAFARGVVSRTPAAVAV